MQKIEFTHRHFEKLFAAIAGHFMSPKNGGLNVFLFHDAEDSQSDPWKICTAPHMNGSSPRSIYTEFKILGEGPSIEKALEMAALAVDFDLGEKGIDAFDQMETLRAESLALAEEQRFLREDWPFETKPSGSECPSIKRGEST